jgi:hypothetical protein
MNETSNSVFSSNVGKELASVPLAMSTRCLMMRILSVRERFG